MIGCVPAPKDVSDSSEIASLKIIGQCLMLKEDAPLYCLGRPFPRVVVHGNTCNPAQGGPAEHIADLRTGTRLRIEKVLDAVSYNDGLFQARRRHTFARIESGPEMGRLVDLGAADLPPEISELYARCPQE
jgi:hypothetical protein